MACEHARGRLAIGQPFVHEGILGTTFTGRLVAETTVGEQPAVVPTISGRAWITGFAQYVLEPDDPFPTGYTLTDIWATRLTGRLELRLDHHEEDDQDEQDRQEDAAHLSPLGQGQEGRRAAGRAVCPGAGGGACSIIWIIASIVRDWTKIAKPIAITYRMIPAASQWVGVTSNPTSRSGRSRSRPGTGRAG